MALETTFNDKMVEITEKFTKGKITGLSFLDFPGIENSIGVKYLDMLGVSTLKLAITVPRLMVFVMVDDLYFRCHVVKCYD